MDHHCDIAELLPGGASGCPVCERAPRTEIVLDAWDELRALSSSSGPEPLVLPVG